MLHPKNNQTANRRPAGSPDATEADAKWHRDAALALGTTNREWADAEELMRHDRCATLEDQLRWLRDAGFENVDCLFKMRRFAGIAAISATAAGPS
jgi:hypothetical protein